MVGPLMPTYKIEFVGSNPGCQPMIVHCVDDAQVMQWVQGFLGTRPAAEVSEGERQVGWVTASGDDAKFI
jgi:hypothetical protein